MSSKKMSAYLSQWGRQLTDIIQYDSAKLAYRRVLERDPNHAKVLQQLGWLHHQQSPSFASQDQAIEYLEKSVSSGTLCGNSFSQFPQLIYAKTIRMRKAGTFSVDATCLSRNTQRPMRPISKQSTVTGATQRFGARSVSFITRSTSTVMHSMHTLGPSV